MLNVRKHNLWPALRPQRLSQLPMTAQRPRRPGQLLMTALAPLLLCLTLLTSLASLAACRPGELSRDDANAPTGWATCESIRGGTYDLSGGAYCPEKGVQGRKIILLSTGEDMRATIEEAIRRYDIVVLDGSEGPFLYSQTSIFDSLRNKTIVGIHGATLQSAFQCTPDLKEAFKQAEERLDGTKPEADGRFRLSNDSLARNFAGYAAFQTLIDRTGDTQMRFRRSGFWTFRACSNLVIRNLFFDGPGAFRGKPDTMLRLLDGTNHVWIDHCTFEDPGCLALGIVRHADCITASWCRFRFTPQSNGHELAVLIASGDDNWFDEDFLNVTFDHCAWENVWSRIPMARFGTVHILNNAFDCPGTVGINPRTNAEFLIEGCSFAPDTRPFCAYRTDVAPPRACVFRNCTWDPQFEVPELGEVSVPYKYAATSPERARAEVESHAGPTLTHPLHIKKAAR